MLFSDAVALHMGLKIHQEWGDIGIILSLLAKLGTRMFTVDELLINVSVGLSLCCKSRSQWSSFHCHCSLTYHSPSVSSHRHFSLSNSLCSLSTSLCSLSTFLCSLSAVSLCLCSSIWLMIKSRAVASRWLSYESVMSVSELEAPSVASFFVARHHDIAVLALFWYWYGYLCCL